MTLRRRLGVMVTALGLSLMPAAASVSAEDAHPVFVAQLSGFQEVPAASTLARGYAGVLTNTTGTGMYYSITLTDASTRITAAHIHLGARDVAGPVVVPLCTPTTTPCASEGMVVAGTFDASAFTGQLAGQTLEALIAEMRAGNAYINTHSEKFPGGEARGQLVDVDLLLGNTVPTDPSGEPPSEIVEEMHGM